MPPTRHLKRYFQEVMIMPPEEDENPEGDFDPEHPPRDPEEDD